MKLPVTMATMTRLVRLVLAVILSLAFAAGMATAAENGKAAKNPANPFDLPMYFVIVRSNAGYCEPYCPEWIYGEGQIDAGTPAAFRKILELAGDRHLPLVVLSPGGNVEAAIEMGRIIRKNRIPVQVGYTRFYGCSPRDKDCVGDSPNKGEFRGMTMVAGAFCWSACPLVLAAGERRLSSDGSNTGVHQITTVYQREKIMYRERYRWVNGKKKVVSRKVVSRKNAGTQSTTKLPKSTRKLLIGYFRDMGVDKSLLDAMLSTPPTKIRKLGTDEMLKMRLITEASNPDVLTAPMACAHDGAPDNCIMRNPPPETLAMPQNPPEKS